MNEGDTIMEANKHWNLECIAVRGNRDKIFHFTDKQECFKSVWFFKLHFFPHLCLFEAPYRNLGKIDYFEYKSRNTNSIKT